MQAGILAGYPVVDVKVTLYDGSYHEVDSSEMAFKIAGSMAFKEAMQKADPVIMEPIMKVDCDSPGGVYGRRHRRPEQPPRPDPEVWRPVIGAAADRCALVPLSEMFGYATDLRCQNPGPRPATPWSPATMLEVPKSIADKIISERKRTK